MTVGNILGCYDADLEINQVEECIENQSEFSN